MKYDLIIVGAGPGGCMAARKAARDGLNVLVIEKLKEAGKVTRFCSRLLRLGEGGFSSDIPVTDVNIRRTTCTIDVGAPGHHVIRMHGLPADASFAYAGELDPCFNESWVSPSGATFNRDPNNRSIDGFVIDKEVMLHGLLDEAAAAGCKIQAGTRCLDIEDTDDGVRLRVKTASGEETLLAKRAILADGSFSPLATQLGFDEGRGAGPGKLRFMSFILDRCDVPFREMRRARFTQPSVHRGFLNVGPWPPGHWEISCSAPVSSPVRLPQRLEAFITNSAFSYLFKGATIVDRQGCSMDLRPPVRDAARGNVICIGDNLAYAETAIKGAFGCGYMAAEATAKALDGKPGNDEYNHYWTHAFNFFSPQYTKRSKRLPPIPVVLDDAETDQLFAWFTANGIYGMPADILPANREKLTADLPGIAAKFFGQDKIDRGPALTGEEAA
ncbi:MAG: NAD(P)/FAD-dependent oxidoreductase [Gammaproteobacteria bacterium]|nr:NAD(P)/FAD-dependent oxidoreductase [Gammaproteobacteria bacterium]MDH5275591.1 NAD(P)/FAD-dependent oxidoreductase [Gammaproteobacteria bacterium]